LFLRKRGGKKEERKRDFDDAAPFLQVMSEGGPAEKEGGGERQINLFLRRRGGEKERTATRRPSETTQKEKREGGEEGEGKGGAAMDISAYSTSVYAVQSTGKSKRGEGGEYPSLH